MRGAWGLDRRIFAVAFVFLALLAGQVPAQTVSDEVLREAAIRTGLSEDELLRRAQAKDGAEVLAPPGRVELPGREIPVIILPLSESKKGEPELAPPSLRRADVEMRSDTFGAEFFRLGPEVFRPSSFGPVPENYLVGVGDQIFVDVWGEVEFRLERVVDRDGSIILPKGGKIFCAGRTLSKIEADARKKLAQSYSGISTRPGKGNTFVDVSLGSLRAIRVFVVGEAAQPGAYELSSVSTIFTALYAAGGPSKNGSLRQIHLMRGDAQISVLDLYDYLLEGKREGDEILREGDTVYIPTREKTVRLRGAVHRPLAFELRKNETLGDLLRFSGGFTARAATDVLQLKRILPPADRRPNEPDRIHVDIYASDLNLALFDGDEITVRSIVDRIENWVEIQGNVKQSGRYEFHPGMTVADLVKLAGGPWQDTLEDRALIDRVSRDRRHFTFDFDLGRQLRGEGEAIELSAMDQMKIFSIWDLQDRFTVEISGQVRRPGTYEFRERITLHDLILKAGGLLESADLLNAEVFRLNRGAAESRDERQGPERVVDVIEVSLGEDWLKESKSLVLKPHDHVAVRSLPWWELPRNVELRGEVLYPGIYSLERPDERLSSLVERAGGLKPTADRMAARIDRSKDGIGNVALDLKGALGKPGGKHDPVLAAGDVVTVPPVSYTVKVVGAVGFATSVIYVKGRSFKGYVDMAGGFADGADKRRARVVYPNGMSRSMRWFGTSQPKVLPGSTIVVPWEKPSEGDSKLQTLKEIASIVASVATVWLVIDRTQ